MSATRLGLVLGCLVAAASVEAKECSTPAARDGAPAPRSCAPPRHAQEAIKGESLRYATTPGFIPLGNGTEIRISGRVRADAIVPR